MQFRSVSREILKRIPINWESPYTLSALVHIGLILILSVIYLKPEHKLTWHSFEWEQPEPLEERIVPPRTERFRTTTDEEENSVQSFDDTHDQDDPGLYETKKEAEVSDYIQPPKLSNSDAQPGSAAPISPSNLGPRFSIPKGRPAASGSGSGNYQVSTSSGIFFDENYRVAPKISNFEYARITLTFRLAHDGRVLAESIVAKEVSNLSYLEPTKEALIQWRVRTRFHPDETYEITFIFNPS